MTLIYPIFGAILAFGSAVYGDGRRARKGDDPVSETIDSAASFVSDAFSGKARRDSEALDKLEKLKNLRDTGVLSEEEYEKMKIELLELENPRVHKNPGAGFCIRPIKRNRN